MKGEFKFKVGLYINTEYSTPHHSVSIICIINDLLARFTSTAAAGGSRGQEGSQAAAGEGSPGLAQPRGSPGDSQAQS